MIEIVLGSYLMIGLSFIMTACVDLDTWNDQW